MISPSRVHPRFWVPVWSDPKLAAEAEDLALNIAGDAAFADILALAGDAAAPAHILALARDAAEPRIDLRRVREVKWELSRRLPSQSFADLVAAAKLTKRKSPARSMILAIHRYEQRAYSRWKKADRALNAALRRQQRSVFRLHDRLQRRIDKRAKKAKAA
jgi:hypothetical protein